MKAILFDLGNTLESEGSLVADALATLSAMQSISDAEGHAPFLGLVSDYKPATSPAEIADLTAEYYGIITDLGLREFFEPLDTHVTLSTQVGFAKPDPRIFRKALDKLHTDLPFDSAAFITENASHITSVRASGMKGICVGGLLTTSDDVDELSAVIPLLASWLMA